jgi:hypothetical protein
MAIEPFLDTGIFFIQMPQVYASLLLILMGFVIFQQAGKFSHGKCTNQFAAGFQLVTYAPNSLTVGLFKMLLELWHGLIGIATETIDQFSELVCHDFEQLGIGFFI